MRNRSHFMVVWPDTMNGRTAALRLVVAYIFQAKTHKTKVKHAMYLYKHAKATNCSLKEVVVGG